MSMHSDQVFLMHIVDAVDMIGVYIEGLAKDDFLSDQRTQDAVIRQLEIVGEAAGNLSEELRNSNPDVPWRVIRNMRNRLIHGYFRVNLVTVWNVTQDELPILRAEIDTILQLLDNSSSENDNPI